MSYYSGYSWAMPAPAPVYDFYTPPPVYYSPPPPAYDYTFAAPNYGYTMPAYDFYTPISSYTPPSFTYTPTYFTPTSYDLYTPSSYSWSDPISSYTPDPYDFGTPSFTLGGVDLTKPSYQELLYTVDPMSYDREQIAGYIEDTYGVPYAQFEQDYYGGPSGFNLDPDADVYRYGDIGGGNAYSADIGGGSYDYGGIGGGVDYGGIGGGDIYSGISNLGAYDFGTDADYGTGYGSSSSSNYFDNASGVQVAAVDPRLLFGGTMTDSPLFQPDLYNGFSEGISAGTQMPGSVNPQTLPGVEGGATNNIGVTPLADGSAVISRPDGSSITLDNEQFNKLLSGDNSVLGATSNEEKFTDKFGGTTNIAKDDFSLDGYTSAASKNFASSGDPSYTKYPASYGEVPVEDIQGKPVTKAPVDYTLPSTIGKGAPVEDYRIDPITGELTKFKVTNQQGLQSKLPDLGGAESNYSFSPLKPRAEGINPDRIATNSDRYRDLDLTNKTYSDYVDPNRPVGTGLLAKGKQLDEILPENMRKYSNLDPDTEYTIGPDGKPVPAYRKPDDLLYKVSPEVQRILDEGAARDAKKYTPEVERALISSSSRGGGGGGGGGGSAPRKQQQQQQQQKKSGLNPLLLAMLAALAAKGIGGGKSGGAPASSYDLQRTQAELEKGRRAGSSAQRYYTGPGTVKKAGGGITSLSANPLGGYSDGGRLLRGPGDGVSDSIPATIGKKQPARLADGEFVVPARIVSELGNGSTEAGARKLYAMMDRVQKARKKTVGKNKVAHNSRADKYLPK